MANILCDSTGNGEGAHATDDPVSGDSPLFTYFNLQLSKGIAKRGFIIFCP